MIKMKKYKRFLLIFAAVFTGFVIYDVTLSFAETKTGSVVLERFYNPFKRTRHGPPLKNVTHKVGSAWIFDWIKNPKNYDPNSRMPNLLLEDDEVKSIMAYLASVADKDFPKVQWDAFLTKLVEELTDEESDKVDKLTSTGKGGWGKARCNICHAQKGIGGFVKVAPDLGKVGTKLNRDWLYYWLKNPRDHFPDTMMPQYRLPDEELKPLIEYILKSEDFMPEYEEEEEETEGESEKASPKVEITYSKDPAVIENGKRIITVSRCVVCHEIEGIEEVLPVAEKEPAPTEGFAKLVTEIRCLTCHNIRGEGGTFAPELTHEGNKLKNDWVIDFLKTPNIVRPILQQMPRFNLSDEEVKIAADYIKKNFISEEVPADLFKETAVNEEKAEAGKTFFYNYGCSTCHAVGALGGVIGPNLDSAGDRLEPNYMFWHLKDPRHAALDTVEPRYNLTDEEITSLIHFLLTCTKKGTS